MKRKIAAILAADAAEYSRLVAEDEEEALRQLVASVAVFKASVEAHGGRIFNTAGDAVLAEFQSAVQAVRSAIDIQATLSTRNQPYAPARRMMFRMGISIGDVVENDGDLLGDGVNIAARLQGLAQPGGLAISRWVQEQVAGKVTVEFRDAGYQHVKNMPAPIHVFQSNVAAPAKETRPATPSGRPARPLGYRLAVAGAAAVFAAAVAFVVTHEPAGVALREVPTETPAPLAATTPQTIDRPASDPQHSPPAALEQPAPKKEASVEPAGPLEPAPQPSTAPETPPVFPAQQDTPPVPAPEEPAQAAVTPTPEPAAPENGQATTLESERAAETPPAAAPVLAREATSDPNQIRMQCAQIIERAQLGDLTSDDRTFLRNKCR